MSVFLFRCFLCLVLVICTLFLPLLSHAVQTADPPSKFDALFHTGESSPFAPDTPLLELFYLETKRSDAIFLRCNGRTLLVDGGNKRDFRLLERFLLAENGSLRVDTILNTHEDNDHLDGLIALLQNGGTANEFLSPSPANPKTRRYDKLLPALKKAEIPYTQVFHGETWQLGGGHPESGATLLPGGLETAMPGTALIRMYCSRINIWDLNRSSLVLHITFGKRTALLMADATGKTQWDFLNMGNLELKAEVYKAPHHGVSGSVEAFLTAVEPKLTVITNDRKGSGFQTRQMQRMAIPTFYTNEGTVYLATDGETWYYRQMQLPLR